jgi:hypothetical protein
MDSFLNVIKFTLHRINNFRFALLAQTYNPSYSGRSQFKANARKIVSEILS